MNVTEIKAMIANLRLEKEKLVANVNFVSGGIEAFEAVLVELEKSPAPAQGAPLDEDLENAKKVAEEVIGEVEDPA